MIFRLIVTGFRFSYAGGSLAHAWAPAVGMEPGRSVGGDVHVDADERWIEGEAS